VSGNVLHLSLTTAGRNALARIAELEALLFEEQALRSSYGDELARLKASSCVDATCCIYCQHALTEAFTEVLLKRISVRADPAGTIADVVALLKEKRLTTKGTP
jgi:hypothetical protein